MNKNDINNQLNLNNIPNDNNQENIKELLIKELSENLNIEVESTTNVNGNELGKNSLTTIIEESSENFSHPSYASNIEKNLEKKEEDIKDKKIEESIIQNMFDDQTGLISFNGDNNDIENIVENLQCENMRQEFSIITGDYLEAIEYSKISAEQIMKIIQTINPTDLTDCKKFMDTLDYDGKTISRISNVDFLLIKSKEIDNKDMDEIKKMIEEKTNALFAWREILPGADSFFRAIMFSFLEEIVLSRNINNYQSFLYVLNQNLEDDIFKSLLSKYKIDCLKAKICLILIYYALIIKDEDASIEKAHSLLIKTYNYDINFDLLLILNLKFLIYNYLKRNQNKLYAKEYSFHIGNFLPPQYKTKNGNYKFDEFYNNNLLTLNNEPEKLIKSVIPFILRRDLFIYYFEQKKISRMLIHADGKKNKDFIPFRLVILNGSYEIVYHKDYYKQFEKIFSKFSNISNNKVDNRSSNINNISEKILENIDDEKLYNNNNSNKSNNISNNIKLNVRNSNNKANNQNQNNIVINNQTTNKNSAYYDENNINNNANYYSNNIPLNNIMNNYQSIININPNNNNFNNNMNNNTNNIINNDYKLQAQKQNFKINTVIQKRPSTARNNFSQNREKDALEAFLELPLESENNIKVTTKKSISNEQSNSSKQINDYLHIKNKSDILNNQASNMLPGKFITKECPSCKKPVNDNFYCDACLLNCLNYFVQDSYIKFIKNNISNLIKDRPKETLSSFLNNLVIIFPNKLTKKFNEAYSLLTNNNKLFFNEKLKSFKSSLCLGCFNVINRENKFISYNEKGRERAAFLFKFPCGCIFCSGDCLNRFINAVPITKIKSFICGCGVTYDYIQLKFLLFFAVSHNLIKFKKEILRYMYEIIKNKCCKCKIEIPLVTGKKNNVNIMEVSDLEAQTIFSIHTFNHLICEKCVKSKEISKNKFYCNLCSSEHSIISKKKIQNCEIRNTCSIF